MAKAKSKKAAPLIPPEKDEIRQGKWAAGLTVGPVFIDGLTSSLTYLIVACKESADEYQAVVIGKWGDECFKVKMYGCFEDWGFNKSSLMDKFRAEDFLNRNREGDAGYQRYFTDREGVRRIIHALGQTRGVLVAPFEKVFEAYNISFYDRQVISERVHPRLGGFRPESPFNLLTDQTPEVGLLASA
jgi:hypothetical protein